MQVRPRGQIRSHRALKKRLLAPWIVTTMVVTLVATGVSVGFYILLREPCKGTIKATVVAPPNISNLLESVARGWSETKPVVNGKCALVNIESEESVTMATALEKQWSSKNGMPPDAWVPDSSVWSRQAAMNPTVAKMFPGSQPSLATSISVIAMPRPMAEALGWPSTKISWATLLTETSRSTWDKYGHPNWGPMRIGMTDPTQSTSGLLALVSLAEPSNNGTPSERGAEAIRRLKEMKALITPSTDSILTELTKADRQGADAVFGYLSAFPALEADVLTYNQGNPTVPLAAVYPSDTSVDADNPCIVLDAPWSDPGRKKVAEGFLRYARTAKGRAPFMDVGYRDSKRTPSSVINEGNGLSAKTSTPIRYVPAPNAMEKLIGVWGDH